MPEVNKRNWSEETLEAVEKLCLFDDDFMSLVFERNYEAADMYNDLLKKQVHYFKESEGGRTEMCEIIERLSDKRVEETRINGIVDSVKSLMTTMKLSVTQAFDALQVSESDQRIVIKRI